MTPGLDTTVLMALEEPAAAAALGRAGYAVRVAGGPAAAEAALAAADVALAVFPGDADGLAAARRARAARRVPVLFLVPRGWAGDPAPQAEFHDCAWVERGAGAGVLVAAARAALALAGAGADRARRVADAWRRLSRLERVAELGEVLRATLDEAEALTGSTIGFYHFVEADQRTLALQMWSTNTLAHMCQADGRGNHYPIDRAGVWVDCVAARAPVVHNDYPSLPHRRGLPPGHAPVTRELVVPIERGGLVVAILGVGNKPEPYGQDDIDVVEHLADLAWDIAERKRVEETVRTLEARLREEHKLSAVGTLADGVAHEINNPLTGVINYAQLIQDGLPAGDDRLAGYCAEIINEGTRIAAIVRSLLSFSRQDRGAWTTEDPGAVVRGVLELTDSMLSTHGVALATEYGPGLPPVRCSAPQVQQVVLTLLVNGRDALDARWPGAHPDKRLRVEVRPFVDDGGRWVRIEVRDYGHGIAPEARERVFEPFFTTKDRTRSTGLGLSIAHGIAREHGGRLTYDTWPDGGTAFRLDLPALPPRAPGSGA